jgi:cytochrome c556
MRKSIVCFTLTAIACAVVSSALAQQRRPEAVIKDRQSLMTMQNWALRDIALMVKGQRPYDPAVIARSAELLDATNKMILEAFPPGTESGAPNRARPEIWSDPEKFKQALAAFQAEVPKLVEAAKAGTPDALRSAFSAVAKGCDGCHDSFRAKR